MPAPHGLRHGKATVPFEDIKLIRELYEHHGVRPKELAHKFDVSINTIWDWVQYKTRAFE
jgi:DNA-binding transcriptional regulator YiaG